MMNPVNKNATAEARALLNYLQELRGKGILTGQHTLTMDQKELWYIEQMTGKLPAVCGFELLSCSPNIREENCDAEALAEIRENRGTLQRAYEWAQRGGIITFTWHWYSPIGGWNKSFFSQNTDFDASNILKEGTPEREAFYSDLDAMAALLQGFYDQKIPILWRPFHEAHGDWFWWGKQGQQVARELWRMMFRYYTEVKHLDNLIWVWNNPEKEGYVGDEYCDIISGDWYLQPHEHTGLSAQYAMLRTLNADKPAAIGEVGILPDLDAIVRENTDWLWFMTWSGPFVLEDRFNTPEVYNAVYRHPYAITLDKLNFNQEVSYD